jgi:hypothetical protein
VAWTGAYPHSAPLNGYRWLMTAPGSPDSDQHDADVPPANPAYATPPPDGLPDAESADTD